MVDILQLLSQKSGLRFELVPAKNRTEVRKLILAGDADLVAGLPYYYASPEKLYEISVLLTSPVLHLPVVRAISTSATANAQRLLVYSDTKLFPDQEHVQYEESIQEILRLVEAGTYVEAYVDGYSAQHYLAQGNFHNIELSLTPYGNYSLCLGVARGEDLRLISIPEQAIATLKPSELEGILYQNTAHTHASELIDVIKRDPLPFVASVFAVLSLVVALLSLLLLKTRRLNRMISAEKRRYKILSQSDGLTKLLNNTSFRTLAKRFLSQPSTASGTLLIIDIDNFKEINDTFGHLAGDEVLSELARLLISTFREEDIIGRIGGDEFSVLLKGPLDESLVEARCRQLLLDVQNLGKDHNITLSIGGALFQNGAAFEALFSQADAALYEVKRHGRNSVQINTYKSTEKEHTSGNVL